MAAPPNRLAVRELGAGAPLLVLNGYAATKDDWDPTFLDVLATRSRVICPDNRGMGGSPAAGAGLTIAAMADDIVGLLDALAVDRTDLLGWSMGGFVAQAVAARVPGRITRLVLLATDHGGPEAVTADPAVWQRLTDRSGTPREQATRLLGLLFPPAVAAHVDDEFGVLVAQARSTLNHPTLDAQERAIGAWHREPSAERLTAIGAPALIAAGVEDIVIPAVNAERLAAAMPGARRHVLPGCGHALMAQEPDALTTLINAWLRG
jgi:pimeloyl-ACP methyl ester carboxylesterase